MSNVPFCICVPARNEAYRLPVLLKALVAQSVAGRIAVALCINNSDDGSAATAAEIAARHIDRLELHIDECTLSPRLAHAGTARRRAMDAGAALLGAGGLLISTDADCRPPSDWIAANLAAYAGGAGIVGGQIRLDDREPVAPAVATIRERYDLYWAAVRAIEDAVDPSPHDLPPRHGDHTGASLAIDAGLYRAVGGVPTIPCGEDRALVTAAVAAGGRLAHPMAVWTRVSPRTRGRAEGGMAAAMAALMTTIAQDAVPLVARYEHWRQRATWRRDARARLGVATMLAHEERLPPMPADMPLPSIPAR